jgi:hypothetical protein
MFRSLKSPAAVCRNAQPSKTAKAGAANIMGTQAKSQRWASPPYLGRGWLGLWMIVLSDARNNFGLYLTVARPLDVHIFSVY